jgi:SAM-dependent methyltransferase
MNRTLIAFAFLACVSTSARSQLQMEKVFRHPKLEVSVPDFPAEGLILDIGGGGEGVIGQLKGKQVIAIDLSKRELEEAPDGPLIKIVMDARDLKFLDGTFATTTVFFTFMYINPNDHEKVMQEIYRILRPGGRLLVWDALFPKRTDERQTTVLYPLHIKLPSKEINTGYGIRLIEDQGADHFLDLAKKTGFLAADRVDGQGWFSLELKKP